MEKTYYITGNQLWAALRDRVDVTVPTLADRDALMTYQRRWGMLVYVFADPNPNNNGPYFLKKENNILADNTNWEKWEGGESTGDKHYTYSILSQSYVGIQHNLGKKPAVTVLDTNGDEVFPDILHIDENTTTITFAEIFTGTVTFN